MYPTIQLQPGKERTVLRGHPWIFPKAIASEPRTVSDGQLVNVSDASGKYIAKGIYNSHSLYRVRILLYPHETIQEDSVSGIINYRLEQAASLRRALDLPHANTNAFRLFNSEADGLSGLTIDYYDGVYVVMSTAYWVQLHQSSIIETITKLFQPRELIWMPQSKALQQDGWLDIPEVDLASKGKQLSVEIFEEGIRYQVQFSAGQKSGLFLDQRENHTRIASYARGKRVLDLYTYCGGFALHAAKSGASKVTAVDSSVQAIEMATINAKLNHVDALIHFEVGDSREFLAQAADYDLIILDPPKLIPSKRHLEKAKNYYRFLHRELLKVMQPGSLLLTCNCSSALSTADFLQLVVTQAEYVGKHLRILGTYGPATCHPLLPNFPEGNYLTAILLAVM